MQKKLKNISMAISSVIKRVGPGFSSIRRYSIEVTEKAKSFHSIPGPKGFLRLGNLFNYLPGIGKYSWDELHKASLDKYLCYGSIVKERMLPGTEILWLFDSNDIAAVLTDDTKTFPQRRSHLALAKFRKDRSHIYNSGGLLPTNGPEWWRLRSELQKGLSSLKSVRHFLPDIDDITTEFVQQLKSDVVINILPELARLNLEVVCCVAFDVRMDSFSEYQRHPKSRSSKLIASAEITNSCILQTDQGLHLWQYFDTPKYRRLKKAQCYMERAAIDLISQKISFFKEDFGTTGNDRHRERSPSLLEEYLKNPKLDLADILGMAADLLLAGIDTTTYTTCFALYYVSQNKDVQEKVFQEALKILPQINDELSAESITHEIPYTRAVLKETFRLNPISFGIGRILNKDLVLSGYHIPKDTVVVTQNMVACRLERNFKNANEFIPERWLERNNSINPYLVLPFGHGMRACIARRLAEQNILVLLLRIIRCYYLEWAGKPTMDVKTLLINKPDQPVRIKLTLR